MRYLQKIVQNGNSSQVTLGRALMAWCDLVPGQAIIVEALEDKSIRVRAPGPNEFLPKRPARIVLDNGVPTLR